MFRANTTKKYLHAALSLFILFAAAGCAQTTAKPAAGSVASLPAPVETAAVASPTPTESNKRLIPAKIVRVVDGDTMKVSFTEAGKVKEETIRLLLVDTPESVAPDKPVQPFALEASKYAKDMLTNKDVKLELDVSERDKYGRLLCYLYIGDKMFNEMLLENGYARVAYVYPPNVKYVDQFREIQKTAQLKGINIWSVENYAQEDGFHENAMKAQASPAPSAPSASTAQPTASLKPSSSPVPKTETKEHSEVYYNNCTEAKAAGAYNIKKGEPGYSSKLDRDHDGVACEK
ncbi:thermonuclease family protein [Paenibacillus alba]|uniref:Thermonuclease family protein n=1 Tax=Paenibacillus alba TaxID=1197127 RepID=A0ABU6G9U8_9BACL|nr:thermonuclease family protein [Paenibacillus alba]MEC0230927.1 thermonuclease family protein [Paenibacillus alba]